MYVCDALTASLCIIYAYRRDSAPRAFLRKLIEITAVVLFLLVGARVRKRNAVYNFRGNKLREIYRGNCVAFECNAETAFARTNETTRSGNFKWLLRPPLLRIYPLYLIKAPLRSRTRAREASFFSLRPIHRRPDGVTHTQHRRYT